jgi:hypothetical protein
MGSLLRKLPGVLVLLWGSICVSFAQESKIDSVMSKLEDFSHYLLYRNHDSTYIQNYGSELTLRLIAINKFNFFRLKDKVNNSTIRYRPDRRVNLGLGVAFKWFSLDVAFNVGIGEDTDFKNKQHLDFQGNIFSSKQYISVNLQYYYGHRLTDYSGFTIEPDSMTTIRDDIRTIRFGLQYVYAFNYDKFSLKAPFILNEKQLKNAGSWMFGVGFSTFIMDADSSVVPAAVMPDFDPVMYMTGLNVLSLSFQAGYMYSFIFGKDFFVTLGAIPGLTLNMGDYQTENRKPFSLRPDFIFTTMNALGYNGRRIYAGVHFIGDLASVFTEKQMKTDIGSGKAKFFVGYRFREKKTGK